MKTLFIVRHAKSGWKELGKSDFERHILPKGEKRTLLICNRIKQINIFPEFILTSEAVRAKETTQLIAKEFALQNTNIHINKSFYLCDMDTWIEAIESADNKINKLMVVGHNLTLTYLANYFLPNRGINDIPTSGVVCIKFECDNWTDISTQNANLIQFFSHELEF